LAGSSSLQTGQLKGQGSHREFLSMAHIAVEPNLLSVSGRASGFQGSWFEATAIEVGSKWAAPPDFACRIGWRLWPERLQGRSTQWSCSQVQAGITRKGTSTPLMEPNRWSEKYKYPLEL
jgi:hypothetical protein